MKRLLLYLALITTEASLNVVTESCEMVAERHPLLFVPLVPGYLAIRSVQKHGSGGNHLLDGRRRVRTGLTMFDFLVSIWENEAHEVPPQRRQPSGGVAPERTRMHADCTSIRRTYRYRLYPNKAQGQALDSALWRCRELYNAALEERKEAWRMRGVRIGLYDQQAQLPAVREARPEYAGMNISMLRNVLRRLDRAFLGFFRRVERGEKAGYPRFKGRDRYDSLTFENGWKIRDDARLYLQGIGNVKVRWSRDLQGRVKTVTVRRDTDQWYVCFSCEVEAQEAQESGKPAVGIDVGLESFATLSDGMRIENPRYRRESEQLLRRRQRQLSRRKKGSKRRAKARFLVAKAHRKVRNQRRDFHHKESCKVVDRYGLIAVEDLNIAGMQRNHHFSKSINDAGWSQFLDMLTYKAEGAGGSVVRVNPSGTSQTCVCGSRVEKALSDRWHSCSDCGASMPRDRMSALVILNRAGQALQASTKESAPCVA